MKALGYPRMTKTAIVAPRVVARAELEVIPQQDQDSAQELSLTSLLGPGERRVVEYEVVVKQSYGTLRADIMEELGATLRKATALTGNSANSFLIVGAEQYETGKSRVYVNFTSTRGHNER
jgi:hypothetical protein